MVARYTAVLLLATVLSTPGRAQGGCPATVTDIDGNTYPVVQIGGQCWTAQNLTVVRYANGDSIPHVPYAWYLQTTGAWCAYDNLPSNDSVFGKLYNWFTVADPRGLCPSGWHIPTNQEIGTVIGLFGGISVAGGPLKAVSPLWAPPNADATNASGFSGLPGGSRTDGGSFINMPTDGFFWTATEQQSITAWTWHLHHDWGGIDNGAVMKEAGLSCRCVYDQLVGIDEEHVHPALNVFPNPTADAVQVERSGAGCTYTLHNAMGQVVLTGRLVSGLNSLDLNALPPGAYLLRTDDAAAGVRVVKH
jgi:uncharacterized protein (TIGR02145 family)